MRSWLLYILPVYCAVLAVIRYDLEFLGLCPCMVDVEIIDAKNDNQSIFVSAGQEACICTKVRWAWAWQHVPAARCQQASKQ